KPKFTFVRDGRTAARKPSSLLTLANPAEDGDAEGGEDTDRVASFEYLAKAEYDQLRDGALSMMKQAPPTQAFYLGVGRSSGAMVALFENLGTNIAGHLPTDGLHRL